MSDETRATFLPARDQMRRGSGWEIAADRVAAFRLRYLTAPRDTAVVKAAAERAGWDPRPSPRPDRSGRGGDIAYAGYERGDPENESCQTVPPPCPRDCLASRAYVLLSRAELDPFWALPGGRIEPGEMSDCALLRELAEELGASEVRLGRLIWVVENRFPHRGQHFQEIGFYYLWK